MNTDARGWSVMLAGLAMGLGLGAPAAASDVERPRATLVPQNPFATPGNPYADTERAPAPTRARPAAERVRPRGPTALDAIHEDDSADPLSQVPDAQMVERDALAARRQRAAEAARRARELEDAERRAARAAQEAGAGTPSEGPRPATHSPAFRPASPLDAALAAPVVPRASLPLPEAPAEDVDLSPAPTARPTLSDAEIAQLAAEAALPPAQIANDLIGAVDDALTGSDGDDEATPGAAAAEGLPSREEIQQAIERVAPSIRQCAPRQWGRVVHVRAVFAGSGRVASAMVDASSEHLTSGQRSCMARAARAAQIVAFERPQLEVSYPIRL